MYKLLKCPCQIINKNEGFYETLYVKIPNNNNNFNFKNNYVIIKYS